MFSRAARGPSGRSSDRVAAEPDEPRAVQARHGRPLLLQRRRRHRVRRHRSSRQERRQQTR